MSRPWCKLVFCRCLGFARRILSFQADKAVIGHCNLILALHSRILSTSLTPVATRWLPLQWHVHCCRRSHQRQQRHSSVFCRDSSAIRAEAHLHGVARSPSAVFSNHRRESSNVAWYNADSIRVPHPQQRQPPPPPHHVLLLVMHQDRKPRERRTTRKGIDRFCSIHRLYSC